MKSAVAADRTKYFMNYQVAWLKNRARLKIMEKSRRIGMTYVQSYEDVLDAAAADRPMDVWFSSADESAAKEYIRYCEQWVKLYQIGAESLGEIIIDRDDDIKALSIQFASGKRINALSSNPKAFRSKGGKLVLDEYAFHKQPEELWKAAGPIITWGFPVRVLSTYNGKGNRYWRMVEDARKGNKWALHTCTIEQAVQQGLVDKILGHKATPADIADFLGDCRSIAGDEETYLHEYMCVPVDEATAWLTWDLITSAEHEHAGDPLRYGGGDCFVGWDVARRKDMSIIWVLEPVGDVSWHRETIAMKNATFAEQMDKLASVFARYRVRRCCIDQTGMGEKVVEDAKRAHGESRVEGVQFTAGVKHDMAVQIKQSFEDRRCRIAGTREIRESHHSVRRETTSAGNVRFDADRSELGHADYFWAHALAQHAAGSRRQPPSGETVDAANDCYLPDAMAGRGRASMFARSPEAEAA